MALMAPKVEILMILKNIFAKLEAMKALPR